jgi:hypothetical protein
MYESKHSEKSAVTVYQVINRMVYFQGELIGIDMLFEISRVSVSLTADLVRLPAAALSCRISKSQYTNGKQQIQGS